MITFTFSASQIRALLRKDILIRWRLPWMPILQLLWPCMIFMLPYLIRLKFGPVEVANCQFPTRQLPTKNHVLPAFYSYICSIENKCMGTGEYEEYSKHENAPMRPIIDIVQIFINDDRLFTAMVELPEKANFISAVTTLVTGGHLDEIRKNVEKVISMIPVIEKQLNGTFDITKVFSNRATFVKSGYLLCGAPFPSTETIPLINDVFYSQDFSEINDDELQALPTAYCKKLYLDVTSSNHGKMTWNIIKPIIAGKILYTPDNEETRSIIQYSNDTFEALGRLKYLSVAAEQILTKLRDDESFQKSFNSLLKLAQSPFVRSLIGDDFNIDQIEAVIQRIRTDPIIYDVIITIKKILECFSIDRFIPIANEDELRKNAYDLNQKRLFYAAVTFEKTNDTDIVYKFHMDTDNTQATIENRNRFWFPGPSGSMLRDMKYHRGFVQIKHAVDIGIIKHKKQLLIENGILAETTTTTTPRSFSVQIFNDDDEDTDDDDWFTNNDDFGNVTKNSLNNGNEKPSLLSTLFNGLTNGTNSSDFSSTSGLLGDFGDSKTKVEVELEGSPEPSTTPQPATTEKHESENVKAAIFDEVNYKPQVLERVKRQGLFDLFSGSTSNDISGEYEIDNMQFYTKQFPYPAYIDDDFKTGIFLAQAVQCAFLLGLLTEIASCVRHFIWMRESRNSMLMRAMGLKCCSELITWVVITLTELIIIFVAVSLILYVGGILFYTKWLFVMIFLAIFGMCLMSFCYMCSTFFSSATIGSVATATFFLISFCPYIFILLFDAHLNSLQNFGVNLSFTTAFAYAWNHIMRLEVQQTGLTFMQVFNDGLASDFGFGIFMIVIDTIIYSVIGYLSQHFNRDEDRFVPVSRDDLDPSIGATMTNVSKIYDDNKIAVSNINLSFPKHQVTCLLGRNGAGKSTIIKLLTGQIVQTTGRVVLSQAMIINPDYDKIGVCSQDNILIPNLTAREHLEMYAEIKMKHGYKSEVDKTLRSLNFGKYEGYEVCQLSGGYQRRLCVAIAFIGSPNVVILDEPCNGVDTKARRIIWDLIHRLRKGRAVIFTTHFLDEAEYLSDSIVMMKNGKIIANHNPITLQKYGTAKYEISMDCFNMKTFNEIRTKADEVLKDIQLLNSTKDTYLCLEIPYEQEYNSSVEFLKYLENLQNNHRINELTIETPNLEQLFKDLDGNSNNNSNGNGYAAINMLKPVPLKTESTADEVDEKQLTRSEAIKYLFWKRLKHFSRNYRMLLCVIVLPAIFELLAMWFIAYRIEDDYDKVIKLSRNDLYPHSVQMLSLEKNTTFTSQVYQSLQSECHQGDFTCKEFPETKSAFYWILDTLDDYRGKRYGGYSFNQTKSIVWYNNKGYHAMMAWLNDLNTFMLQAELNNTEYSITTLNEPWKLGFTELTRTTILRQAGDTCLVSILLFAYSLVIAVASVYLVNERVKGEKLQQRLCGVDTATYWGVAFIWDFLILLLAILICTIIMAAFGMPIFNARQQIWGIIVIGIFFGFACIPAVHIVEKLFSDSSIAIVTIFCMNIIIPLFTMGTIVLLGVIGDSAKWDAWRHFLNRAFLIFPQHAFGDGLVEICKNYLVALLFRRYDIDTYKNPVNSDLLQPHLIALTVLGVFFTVVNILIETGTLHRLKLKLYAQYDWLNQVDKKQLEELKIVSIQNSLKRFDKYDKPPVMTVDNLCKSYRNGEYAVRNITFSVNAGECFGLLGKNGAGKSTIFKMLSGEIYPSMGDINYMNGEISYCPQTNTLDSLLTVTECIEFYGRLRRITNIPKHIRKVLDAYQLESYRDVLVKNLSGGNRRKLTMATTCCGQTSVVLLDEPTSDMDPMTRSIVYRTINCLLNEQRAIVLTSHSISEIDEICHRVAVLKDGQILTCSSPESLNAQFGGYYNVSLYCSNNFVLEVEQMVRKEFPQCVDPQIYGHSIKFNIRLHEHQKESMRDESRENGIDVPDNLMTSKCTSMLTLSELFDKLQQLRQNQIKKVDIRYAVNRCRLDTVFEKILETSDKQTASNGGINSKALIGTPSTGYIHNGYVDTERETETIT